MTMRFKVPRLLLVVTLLLGGCENYVVAEKPWFTTRDTASAPLVRSGWWVMDQPDCSIDPDASSTAWPDCANAALVPRDWKGVLWADDGTQHMLVPGDPMIAQYEFQTSHDAVVPSQHAYLYFGVAAVERDAEGRAMALRYWPALCGPPRPDRPVAATRRPWPGVRLKREGGCRARDIQALREAIEHSRAVAPDQATVRWLRDWRMGDQSEADWLAAQGIRTH
jgi:hypothetical protein